MGTLGRKPKAARRWRTVVITLVVCFAGAVGAGVFYFGVKSNLADPVQVVSHFPAEDTTMVSQSSKIAASFNRPLDGYAERLSMIVSNRDGQRVHGSMRFNDALDAALFEPSSSLEPGGYDVQVRMRDDEGQHKVLASWQLTVPEQPDLADGLGGTVLVVAAPDTRDAYLAEILRAEGLNSFDTVSPGNLTADMLDQHRVVIVGASISTGEHVPLLESWVSDGGNLVTLRPQGRLAELAGLTPTGEILEDAYLKVDTSRTPGRGITAELMQFHGTADRYTMAPRTQSIAELYADEDRPMDIPAVTLRATPGQTGQVAAFSYDLATSVLYTRQGNPEWAGQERDGLPPIRPNDLFQGVDGQSDYVDLDRIGIPQADEQMRLLTKIVELLHQETVPLPRFWYLPDGANVALLMSADDHGTEEGTEQSFDHMRSLEPEGCSVREWQCPRATSWLYPSSPLSDEQASGFADAGFDLGAHVTTQCHNWSAASLDESFARSLKAFRSKYPSLPAQTGSRTHCIAWSDWVTQPQVERSWGIRLDMNYYNWPADWIRDRPGYLTGSALPMRFSTDDGQLIDVFQQETHLVNETWKGSPKAIEELITAAQGSQGYFGVLGTHYDFSDGFDRQLMKIATDQGIPMISAKQLLDFAEGRNASQIADLEEEAGTVRFTVDPDSRVDGMLEAMLPVESPRGTLDELRIGAREIPVTVRNVKGTDYAFFTAKAGSYTAQYG